MSRTVDLAGKLVFETLKLLKENDGEMASSLLMEALSKRVYLDDWLKVRLKKQEIFVGNQYYIFIR